VMKWQNKNLFIFVFSWVLGSRVMHVWLRVEDNHAHQAD